MDEGEPELVELDPSATELDLNHCRVRSMEPGLEKMVNLEFFGLRNNLIKKIENLNALTNLRELELYDNQLTKIENLDTLVNLE